MFSFICLALAAVLCIAIIVKGLHGIQASNQMICECKAIIYSSTKESKVQ